MLRFTTSAGAGESGLARLVHLQFIVAAGDAAIAVSLAGTLFFTLPTDQARPQVALFLLLTMAPFAFVAPFIGPFLDRFRHGRRWAIGTTLALRAFLCWVLADAITDNSRWIFPCALGALVASKAFTVTRATAVPRLLPVLRPAQHPESPARDAASPAQEAKSLARDAEFTLLHANSRISLANIAGAAVGGGVAAALARLDPSWSLRLAFLVFIGATIVAIRLSPKVDSSAGERDIGPLLTGPGTLSAELSQADPVPSLPHERVQRRFRSLQPVVLQGLRYVLGARLMTGFLTFFLAFLLREQSVAGITGALLLGIVVVAAGVGNSLGTVIGNLAKNHSPEKIGLTVLMIDAAMAVTTAVFYSVFTVIAMGLCAGLVAQLAKLSYDALIQRDVPEIVRTSVFARSETVFQIAWVAGGALGISLPLIPQLGFGLIAALLVGILVWTVLARRRATAVF